MKNENCQNERIKELTMAKVRATQSQKAKSPMRFVITLAATATLLAVTAFAAASYIGSFERLRDVVGDETADMLHPVGMGTIVGEYSSDEIRIEVVAVGVFANVVDVYITLEDLVGGRFDGLVGNFLDSYLRIFARVSCVFARGTSVGTAPNIIHRNESGIITLHSREYFVNSVSGDMYFQLSIEGDFIEVQWSSPFQLEIEETRALVAKDLNIENFSWSTATLTEVTISPFTVLLEIHGEQTQGISPRITIHTTAGKYERSNYDLFISSSIRAGYAFDEKTGRHLLWKIPTDFLDLSTVISIEIDDDIITFESQP
jgi:hypothetical protein